MYVISSIENFKWFFFLTRYYTPLFITYMSPRYLVMCHESAIGNFKAIQQQQIRIRRKNWTRIFSSWKSLSSTVLNYIFHHTTSSFQVLMWCPKLRFHFSLENQILVGHTETATTDATGVLIAMALKVIWPWISKRNISFHQTPTPLCCRQVWFFMTSSPFL